MRPSFPRAAVLLLLALLALGAAVSASGADGPTIFTLTDPRGDDHGDGDLIYPSTSRHLEPGDLDLARAHARDRSTAAPMFEATFAKPVRRPDGGPSTRAAPRSTRWRASASTRSTSTSTSTPTASPAPGRWRRCPAASAELAPAFAWEKAICLTPRPADAQDDVEGILLKQLQEGARGQSEGRSTREQAEKIADDRRLRTSSRDIFFPTRIRVSGGALRFFVPDSFLGGPAKADLGLHRRRHRGRRRPSASTSSVTVGFTRDLGREL